MQIKFKLNKMKFLVLIFFYIHYSYSLELSDVKTNIMFQNEICSYSGEPQVIEGKVQCTCAKGYKTKEHPEETFLNDKIQCNYRQKKRFGSLVSAVIVIAFMAAWMALLIWIKIQDAMPNVIFYIMISAYILAIIGIMIALVQRLSEINGGEEDEASKY